MGKRTVHPVPAVINRRFDPECPINLITAHPRNPRQHDDGAIDESIEANGFYGAVIVQESRARIIAGHGRWNSARRYGMATVPVMFVDVDDKTALKILLADNRTNDKAGYDDKSLAEMLDELRSGDDLYGTAYNADEVQNLLDELADNALDDDHGREPDEPKGGGIDKTFMVVIDCANEAEQQRAYLFVIEGGFTCRVTSL